jgi:MvdD-like protein with pre-ATP grasp domain
MTGSVLIISTVVDLATDVVVEELHALGAPVLRVNTEDYPFSAAIDYSIPATKSEHLFSSGILDNEWFSSVWYRRVRVPAVPEEMDPGVYDFCMRETRSALIGGLLGQNTRWMSRPGAIWEAEFKPYQLHLASELGLKIPRTLISNKPDRVLDFCRSLDQVIAKPVRNGHVVRNGVESAIFTTKLTQEDLNEPSGVSQSPTIFQELIPKKYDIRVTIVGSKVFAAAIDSQSDPTAQIDWRRTENPRLPHYPIELPSALVAKLQTLMFRLSLTYGAIDLVLTPDGEYYFLEINPNGQWLWLDDMLSLGISRAVAAWLMGKAA